MSTRQNTSHAVMSQRLDRKDERDDFPTPPWATRALFHHVISGVDSQKMLCHEPASGRGGMHRTLEEFFDIVSCADKYDYGYAPVEDFLSSNYRRNWFDWIITNPPFASAEEFAAKALTIARRGVAIFARLQFAEGQGRYARLFQLMPPSKVAVFTERVPIHKGRIVRDGSTATCYAWFVWQRGQTTSRMMWIPPCRAALERDSDYESEPLATSLSDILAGRQPCPSLADSPDQPPPK